MEYTINKYPKNKKTDTIGMSEFQIFIRNNQKVYEYKDEKTCNNCFFIQPIKEFYIVDKHTGRRKNKCRDCQLKERGVIEIGKQRFADEIFKKGFKRCTVCKNIQHINSFCKNKSRGDGISSVCTCCSGKLHKDYIRNGNKELSNHYVKEYGKYNYKLKDFNQEIIDKLRNEIIEKRKPKYFLDDLSFLTVTEMAKYILKKYKIPITTVEKRMSEGCNEYQCTLTRKQFTRYNLKK
jgi:hypothetical protein